MGGAYLIGNQALPRLLSAAQATPLLPIEDVYVTGLCAIASKVDLIQSKRYNTSRNRLKSNWIQVYNDEMNFLFLQS